MRGPKDLDELFEEQAKAYARLKDDPELLPQVKQLADTAGKMIDIVKIKLTACGMSNMKPDGIPQLGKLNGGLALAIETGEPPKQLASGRTVKLTPKAEELIRYSGRK